MPGVLCEGVEGPRLIGRTNRQRPEDPDLAKPGEILEVTLAPIYWLAVRILRTPLVKVCEVLGANDDACGHRFGLLVAKAGNYSEGFYDSDVIEGIYWSVQNEAKAINLSLGGPGQSWAMERAINYAWERGVVVVAAAGNQNSSTPNYPSGYANVMSVAATNKKDNKAPFSSHGKIDVSAPGVGITSTVPGGGYEAYSGTSMASPHVAALAGLLAAQGRSAVEIRERMQATTKDLGPVGKDAYYGWGRIDASEAVRP